ncbi:MAG: glutamate mutase L [Deltaproteobacteria bacterium]|jgi:uncharacterized protein (TIGR01319 family)|nr:glutamate mutase L [Deltaproteobacteria bacterium]
MGDLTPTTILATDCGSTTTKAILFELTSTGWRQTYRGEAPTTVEKPVADVTIGVCNACLELEELSNRKILKNNFEDQASPFLFKTSANDKNGIDLYISTSSAGGGLQMVVAGVVGDMTAASAERAALGAGAIVMDAISLDDGREPHQRIKKIRNLRPDIILIAGGTDGGTTAHPLELAETILQANPQPRFGETLKLPVIYAANQAASEQAQQILDKTFSWTAVENIRPTLETENLAPARNAIHELFLQHVMSHAPGYKKLLNYSPVPIIPTPVGFGDMIQTIAQLDTKQILAVDIGGATTDVFSVFNVVENHSTTPIFNRTVSANLGMSYSIVNVLLSAGLKNIKRWLPFAIEDSEIEDRLRNKMIRPTTIPQTVEDLLLEQALCREALKLAFAHHQKLATGLKGKQKKRLFDSLFKDNKNSDALVNMLELNLIIGSGGVLSHAPNRKSSALMLIDAFEPVGITTLVVDSIFMLPHLGVLSHVNPSAALEIYKNDCVVKLGTVLAPQGQIKLGQPAFKVQLGAITTTVLGGEIISLPLNEQEQAEIKIIPESSALDFGTGYGKSLSTTIGGGAAGIILDARGREIMFAKTEEERIIQVKSWHREVGL